MTSAHKNRFVGGHNARRNTAALGKLPGQFKGRTAADMAEVVRIKFAKPLFFNQFHEFNI